MDNSYLAHHGIKGMKWGVRRTPEQLGHRKGTSSVTKRVVDDYNKMDEKQFRSKYQTSKKTYAKRYQKYNDPYKDAPLAKLGRKLGEQQKAKSAKKTKTDPVKQMSDDELRKRINRIQMEKQYKQLTTKQTSAGQKFVKDVMANAAKQTATQYASKAMVKGVETLIKAAV